MPKPIRERSTWRPRAMGHRSTFPASWRRTSSCNRHFVTAPIFRNVHLHELHQCHDRCGSLADVAALNGGVRCAPESNYQWTDATDHPIEWGFLHHPLPRQRPREAAGKLDEGTLGVLSPSQKTHQWGSSALTAAADLPLPALITSRTAIRQAGRCPACRRWIARTERRQRRTRRNRQPVRVSSIILTVGRHRRCGRARRISQIARGSARPSA